MDPYDTVANFKTCIKEKTQVIYWKFFEENIALYILSFWKVPEAEQRLICNGKQLQDKKTLKEYKVEDGSTVFLVLRLILECSPLIIGGRERTTLLAS